MSDPYLYEDAPVSKNKLGIKNEKTLDRIEAEQSRANMMLLYEQGFQDFSPDGLREIHRTLFGDIYEWAGQYRIICNVDFLFRKDNQIFPASNSTASEHRQKARGTCLGLSLYTGIYTCFLRFQYQKLPPAAANTRAIPAISKPLVPVSSAGVAARASAGS